jgi:hypothetical protein
MVVLEAETVARARVYPEDSVIERGGSSENISVDDSLGLTCSL